MLQIIINKLITLNLKILNEKKKILKIFGAFVPLFMIEQLKSGQEIGGGGNDMQ